MRRLAILLSVAGLSVVVQAREFWMQPNKFRFLPGETAVIDWMAGEHFTGEHWDAAQHPPAAVLWLGGSTQRDITRQAKRQNGKNLEVPLPAAGTQLFALRTDVAYTALAAGQFDEALAEDGIDLILKERQAHRSSTPVRVAYTYYTKLLLQVGPRPDGTFQTEAGHPLEIVPRQNPYTLNPGDHLECQVFYNRAPLAHQKVKVWSFIGRRVFLQNIFTEKDGTLRFPISNRGPWMVSTVKMEKAADPQADYQGARASLVFGIE